MRVVRLVRRVRAMPEDPSEKLQYAIDSILVLCMAVAGCDGLLPKGVV